MSPGLLIREKMLARETVVLTHGARGAAAMAAVAAKAASVAARRRVVG